MCTLIVLDRVLPGVPLVGAFNRDEYLSRAAAPPALLPPAVDGGLSLVAPQDLEAGGTWMGLNARGLFAGLTNRAAASRDPSHRSRGLLVMDALTKETARKAREWVEGEVRGARYNPFHLLLADGRETHLAFLREGELVTRELEPGLHVITNGDPDDASGTKARWLRKRLQGLPGARGPRRRSGVRRAPPRSGSRPGART